jgi:hypothetical protein
VLKQTLGNALLIGNPGDGRKSVTSIACFIAEFRMKMFDVGINWSFEEFGIDVKKLVREVGVEDKSLCLVF